MMSDDTIKLFDASNHLVPDFDKIVEDVLISVHGENYYDEDTELINTNILKQIKEEQEKQKDEELEKTMELVDNLADTKDIKIRIVDENKVNKQTTFKDFIPVLFFAIVFTIIVAGGYIFLNNFDFSTLIK